MRILFFFFFFFNVLSTDGGRALYMLPVLQIPSDGACQSGPVPGATFGTGFTGNLEVGTAAPPRPRIWVLRLSPAVTILIG